MAAFGGCGFASASPGFAPPPEAQVGGHPIYNQSHFPGGVVGSASSQYSGSTYPSRGQSSWVGRQHTGGQCDVSGGKENVVNAPAPSVRSQISSLGGEDASSLGMSTLSMKEYKGPKKVENLEKDMHYPDVYKETMMSKHNMNRFVVQARDNSVFAKNESSALLTRVQNHEGITKAKKMLEDQLGIYADEERRCQVGIDNVNCNRKDADTAHKKKMADLNKQGVPSSAL
jgi:hypothetical protein